MCKETVDYKLEFGQKLNEDEHNYMLANSKLVDEECNIRMYDNKYYCFNGSPFEVKRTMKREVVTMWTATM